MFIVLLKFSDQRARATEVIEASMTPAQGPLAGLPGIGA